MLGDVMGCVGVAGQVYSSLVLQNLVAEDLRGRVFTYEFVAMTVCTCLAEVCIPNRRCTCLIGEH